MTLFRKHFITVSAIILVSIAILGAAVSLFATQYFKQDRYRLLEHNAQQAAQLTFDNFRSNNYLGVDPTIIPSFGVLAQAVEADIYLVTHTGQVLLYVEGTPSSHNNVTIAPSILQTAFSQGDYRELGRMEGLFSEAHYTVGKPMFSESGQSVAVIFASTPAGELQVFFGEIVQMFTLSALAVLLLSFAAVYLITADLVRPLRKMVTATESFSRSDFSVRVPVETNDEMGQLAASINEMASSLASLEQVRRSFTANVSHELRTPMTTIGGFIDGILDGTIPPERRDHYLQIVSQEIKRLSRLVRSMLNIARMEAGELKIQPDLFDVHEMVTQAVFTFEQPLEAKHIEVRGLERGKIMVEADPDLIYQVVYNLLENAVKFCNENGYIEVFYSEAPEGGCNVHIRNSGEGISKEDLARVFDRFYKTDKSRSRDKGGAGLGLHIVRSIVQLHGGEIVVRSVEGEYCEFMFTIPSPTAAKQKPQTPRLMP